MLSVLLVDDERLIREGLKKMIDWNKHGFTIAGEASDGEEALELLAKIPVHLMITDIKMPFMDGLTLVKEAKERYPSLHIIMLTGYGDFEYLQQCIRLSVNDYLLKPISWAKLTKSLLVTKDKLSTIRDEYPHDLEHNMTRCLLEGNFQGQTEQIKNLENLFINNKISDTGQREILGILFYHLRKQVDILDMETCHFSVGEHVTTDQLIPTFYIHILELMNLMNIEEPKAAANLDAIKAYIKEEYACDITLESLSEKFFFSPSYISKLFSDHGETYVHYLTNVRMEKAKQLLWETKIPIIEVARLCGYPNSKYFSRLFKKSIGQLPSDFRRYG